jgi:hypothetical protein
MFTLLAAKQSRTPSHLFSLPTPTPTTPFRGAQAIFRAKTFRVLYHTFSTAVTIHTYTPLKMEQTQCSETLAFKLQTPVNHPYLLAYEDGTDTVFRNVGI